MRKYASVLLASLVLVATCALGVAAVADEMNNPWTLIGEGYYSPVAIEGENPVLIRRITDSDFNSIQAMLIDNAVGKDEAAAEAAAHDPDVVLPDNMLPDGTLLDAELFQRQGELLAGLVTKKIVADAGSNYIDVSGNLQTMNIRFADNTVGRVDIEKVNVDNKIVLVPQTLDNTATDIVVTPDGLKAIAYTEKDMWLSTTTQSSSRSVLPEYFNGKNFNDLVTESYEQYGANYALWCGQVMPNPDSNIVAYVSNKDNLNGLSIFTYDLNAEQEKFVIGEPSSYYLIIGWVDNHNILCYKVEEDHKETVLVNINGTENALKFEVENPSIISCYDGKIAYSPAGEENAVYVGSYEDGYLNTVFSSQLDGTLRERPGINAFSPDGTQLAVIYVPDNAPNDRLVKVFDLTDQSEQEVSAMRTRSMNNASILEVSWIDDSSLLTVVVQDEHDGSSTYTTWDYTIRGGQDNA